MNTTLEDIRNLVASFVDYDLQPELFASTYHGSELRLFSEKLAQKDRASLELFRKTMGVDSPQMVLVNGKATLPMDFGSFDGAYHVIGGQPYLINVDDENFDISMTHPTEFPTMEYPVGKIQNNTLVVKPATVRFVNFTYYKEPVKTVYATTDEGGFQQFDESNSTPVLWRGKDINQLVQYALESLGVKATLDQINQRQTTKNQ